MMEEIWDPLAPKVPSIARGMRILLVDRDTTSLMFMASILEAHSYKVTTIELPSIAMAIYEERKDEFDVVMANVHLHNITDLEFVQEIIKKKNTPIILMSSAGVMALRNQAPLVGACHFYEKPISSSQLREVWQHVYRDRISRREGCAKKVNDGNETEPVQVVEVPMAQKSVGILIREGGAGSSTPHRNEFQASDPKGKNKQVVGEVGSGHHRDAQAVETEQLRAMAADQNQRCGDRKRANDDDDDDKEGRSKYKRRINPEHSPPKARSEKNQNGRSSEEKQYMRWTKELHFKFTAAISKLGEAKATPKAIQDLMNVPNLSQRQIAHELEKYKAQVQIIMDTCVDTPLWVPSSRNVSRANVSGTAGVPLLQKQQGGLVGTEINPPLRLFPPVSLQPGSLNLKTPNNRIRPGYLGPNRSGHGRHQRSIQIKEREPLPTPFRTNDKGKGKQAPGLQGYNTAKQALGLQGYSTAKQALGLQGYSSAKQALGFQGYSTARNVPPVQYWQNPTRTPTFTRLSEEQHLMAGGNSSANPPNSNLLAGSSTTVAGASANQNIPGDPLAGHGGFDESDDLAWLTPPNSNLLAGSSTTVAGASANQNIPGDPLPGHGGFDESDDLAWLTPPNSNLLAGSSTTVAAASANQNIPGDPLTGHGGFDESDDDLAWLTEWLSRSLKEDDTGPPTFDWSDM